MKWKKTQLSDPSTQPKQDLEKPYNWSPNVKNNSQNAVPNIVFMLKAWIQYKNIFILIKRRLEEKEYLRWIEMNDDDDDDDEEEEEEEEKRKWKVLLSGKSIHRWNQLLWFDWLPKESFEILLFGFWL